MPYLVTVLIICLILISFYKVGDGTRDVRLFGGGTQIRNYPELCLAEFSELVTLLLPVVSVFFCWCYSSPSKYRLTPRFVLGSSYALSPPRIFYHMLAMLISHIAMLSLHDSVGQSDLDGICPNRKSRVQTLSARPIFRGPQLLRHDICTSHA